jgi:hypothetical protein
LVLAGCSNLQEVREYAKESAKLSEYTELTTRFRDTYEREHPYLHASQIAKAQQDNQIRKEVYDDLLKVNQTVSVYMQTLATVAGEDAFDLSKELDSLAGGIKSNPDIGLKSEHVDAISSMAKVVTKWATSSYQNKAVKELIKESDSPLQMTLEGMSALVSNYKKTHENERQHVVGFLETEILLNESKHQLLAALAKERKQLKLAEYNSIQGKYEKAEKGIRSVAEGHRKLAENIDTLSKDTIKSAMKGFANDIKSIRNSLQIVRK